MLKKLKGIPSGKQQPVCTLVHRGGVEKKKGKPVLLEKMHCLDVKLSSLCPAPFAVLCIYSELPWACNIYSACRHFLDNNDVAYSDSCLSCCKLFGFIFKPKMFDMKFICHLKKNKQTNQTTTNHQL